MFSSMVTIFAEIHRWGFSFLKRIFRSGSTAMSSVKKKSAIIAAQAMERPNRYRCGQANRTSRTKFFMMTSAAEGCPDERPCQVGTSRRAPITGRGISTMIRGGRQSELVFGVSRVLLLCPSALGFFATDDYDLAATMI